METSLYFHIPFCTRRCGYCDFITFSGFERLLPNYLSALGEQVSQSAGGEKIHSVYFGGGTPSLVPASDYKKLFLIIKNHFDLVDGCEISLEANPGTVTKELMSAYREIGFNRISFGMQSALEKDLSLLDRSHHPGDVEKAIHFARSSGFDNINLDLIFGLPLQTITDWKFSLETVLSLEPEHLSLYSLIVEEGTPLAKSIAAGNIPAPDEDIAADQFEWACERLETEGFDHYEISNWAKKDNLRDHRCLHNLQYWRLHPYYGFGAGAVGFFPANKNANLSARTMKTANLIGEFIQKVYTNREENSHKQYFHTVSENFEKETLMFVGFRLLGEGVNLEDFHKRFNVSPFEDFGDILQNLIDRELIEVRENICLRLTKKGWLLANQVLREFSNFEE